MTPTTSQPQRQSSPGNFRWVICALLFFSVAVNYIDRLTIGILKGPLSEKLGWTDLDYGYIMAGFSFAYAFGYLFGGRAMDRLGVKRGLPIFVMVWSAAAMAHGLCGLLDVTAQFRMKYPWFYSAEKGFIMMTLSMPMTAAGFMFARVLLGLSEGANFPAAIKVVAEWFPVRERALATGWFNAGTNVGAVLCPIAVPWIFSHIGWEATFYVTGATGFVWVVAWWFTYDHPNQHKRLSPEERAYIQEGQAAVEEKKTKVPWLKLLGYRAVWAYIIAGILAAPAWGFYQSFLPDFLTKKFGAPSLSTADIPNVASFAAKLNDPGNRVSQLLRENLSPETRTLLDGYQSESNLAPLNAALVADLNNVITNETRLDAAAFSTMPLRPKTRELLAQPPREGTAPHINRMMLEDAFPNEIKHIMGLQMIGWWTGAFFALATIGGVLGGWLAGKLLEKGWSLNAARKISLLICALAVVPVFLAPFAPYAWLAVLIVGIAGSAHQGWSANLFSFVSDTMPKEAISSVVGFGGFVGYFTGGFVNGFTGYIVQKTGSYVLVFVYISGMYIISWVAIQLLVPKIGANTKERSA